MRSLLLSLAFVPLLAAAAAAQPGEAPPAGAPTPARPVYVVDRVVAVVNDAIILDSELAVQLAPYEGDLEGIENPKERARRRDKLRAQVLDEMIGEELIVEAAAEANLEPISDKEVDQYIKDTKEDNKLDDATFAQALAAQGVTMAQYRTNVRRQLTRFRAIRMLVLPKVNVSDDEIRTQYDQMVRRSDAVSQVRLAHILLALPQRPTDAEVAAARDKAAQVINRVKGGEEFGKLAAEFSDDTNTKTSGGDLGWIKRGELPSASEQVVFAMQPKDVRGPVAGAAGLQVFYVSELKKTEIKPLEQMKDQIKGELQQRGVAKQTTQWLEDLRKKAYLEIKL
jgi:parvulin-like peptidyl-prolyl isomerase